MLKSLIRKIKYPFLIIRNQWNGKIIWKLLFTDELEYMPKGWRKAFGEEMCKEIKRQLKKDGISVWKYRIIEIKEKYGELRWYDENTSQGVMDIIDKYEKKSRRICVECGKKATKITTAWIRPYCDNCVKDTKFKVEDINEWFFDEKGE